MTMASHFDLAIIGGGPAAAAAAISARQSRLRTVVIARPARTGDQSGESLSPAAALTLRQLGLPQRFLDQEHQPCIGNASAWGSSDLHRYDFIRDPRGHGWHIDRSRFEACLTERARQSGADWRLISGSVAVGEQRGGWELCLNGENHLFTRVVIDATGRAASFARRQGERRLDADRQVAWVTFLHSDDAAPVDTTTWIESVEYGWWYSAIIPSGRMVTVLFSDADVLNTIAPPTVHGWSRLINSTIHISRRATIGGYRSVAPPRLVAAGSGRLSRFVGQGWFAAGDAAIAYDPISGHGLTVALQSGHDAALAAAELLNGDATAPMRYQSVLTTAYERYAEMRRMYYWLEGRWPSAPYWRRRREQQQGA
jgi:flavin-dependent dehydrogenase